MSHEPRAREQVRIEHDDRESAGPPGVRPDRDYDAVYLGDIYCRLYEANFLEQLDDLKEGLRILQGQGKRAYVTTYAAPRNDFLPKVRKMLEASAGGGRRRGRGP